MVTEKDTTERKPSKWLVDEWPSFFDALEACQSEDEVKKLAEATLDGWRKRPSIKKESSLRVPLADTRNEIERRALPENLKAWALTHLAFPPEKWRELNAPSGAKLASRLENQQLLSDPDAIVVQAASLLKSNQWYEVALALTVVTGRRIGEVLKTAEFEKKSGYSVIFSGHLKHGEHADKYEIPTLVPAADVVAALARLRVMVSGSLAAGESLDDLDVRTVTNRFSPAVRDAANIHFGNLVPARDGKTDLYTHLQRAVYARIAVFFFAPPRIADIRFMAQIMGHRKALEGTEEDLMNYASGAHYSDYRIADKSGNIDGRQGLRLGREGVELLDVFKPKEQEPMTTTTTETEEKQGKQWAGLRPSIGNKNRIDAIKANLKKRTADEVLTILLDAYEHGAGVVDAVTPETLVRPELALLVKSGMAAARIEDFRVFLDRALEKEAKFQLGMASRGHGDEDLSTLSMEQLNDMRGAEVASERVRRYVQAIAQHNDNAQSAMDRWFINTTTVHNFMSGKFGNIVNYFKAHQDEIDALNAQYQLNAGYNRKPIAIKDMIQAPV